MTAIAIGMVVAGLVLWLFAALVLMSVPDPNSRTARNAIMGFALIGVFLIAQGSFLMFIIP